MDIQEIAAMMQSKNLSNLCREEDVLVVQKALKEGTNSAKWKMMLSKGKETWLKYTQNCKIFCLTFNLYAKKLNMQIKKNDFILFSAYPTYFTSWFFRYLILSL